MGDHQGIEHDDHLLAGPEKSRMTDYIAQYLEKNREDAVPSLSSTPSSSISSSTSTTHPEMDSNQIYDLSTHLIAIPMESCHELLLELESVQRAILYHCPILVDACIVPAMTRLPLLYVQAATTGQNPARITSILAETVEILVRKHLFHTPEQEPEEIFVANDLTSDGFIPVTMTFSTLEIDGPNNNILHTVGRANDRGTRQLTAFVTELRHVLHTKGYQTYLPPDPHNTIPSSPTDTVVDSTTDRVFRPRIPFMELPQGMDDSLTRYKQSDTPISEDELALLSSEHGGNGISPIFWCSWWDDVFGTQVRLRDVGIYPRSWTGPLPETRTSSSSSSSSSSSGNDPAKKPMTDAFSLPHEIIALPDTCANLQGSEEQFQTYQNSRIEEERKRHYESQGKNDDDDDDDNDDDDIMKNNIANENRDKPDIVMTKTRQRLENLYLQSVKDEDMSLLDSSVLQAETEIKESSTRSRINEEDNVGIVQEDQEEDEGSILEEAAKESNRAQAASDGDFIDDWMRQRIKQSVENLESVKSRKPEKKVKPPIEENEVFKKYKEGTLVPQDGGAKKPRTVKQLDPYPSRDHFVGFWRVVSSPTGFQVDASNDDTKSENLILRVDGTTAAGPTLDLDLKQKAAGGTWKVLSDGDGKVRLRIRLVIPPKKERILVMEGDVTRMSMDTDIPLASKAFGIPHLEAKAKEANKAMEDLIYCGGEV